MKDDHYEGKALGHPDIRALFTREGLLGSPWYASHLAEKQESDTKLWERHIAYLNEFLHKDGYTEEAARLGIPSRLSAAQATLEKVKATGYMDPFRNVG